MPVGGTRLFDLALGQEVSPGTAVWSEEQPESAKLNDRLYQNYRSTWARQLDQMVLDRDFTAGAQWKKRDVDVLLARNQTAIVVNCIEPAVQQACGMLTANNPAYAVTSMEDSDVTRSGSAGIVMSHVWDKADGNAFSRMAIRDYYTTGIGYLAAYYDPMGLNGAGQIRFFSPDSLEVLIDPSSTDIYARDAAHVLLVTTMSGEQIQSMWPGLAGMLKFAKPSSHKNMRVTSDRHGLEYQASGQQPIESYHMHYDVINRYSRLKRTRYRVVDQNTFLEYVLEKGQEYDEFLERRTFIRTDAEGERFISNPKEIEEAQKLFDETGGVWHFVDDPERPEIPILTPGPAGSNARPNSEVRLQPSTMGEFLEMGILRQEIIVADRIQQVLTVGGALFWEGELPITDYPIVPMYANFNRTPFCRSHIRGVRGYQEYINKMYSLLVAHASSSTNVKLLIPRGSQNIQDLEARWAKAGTAVIEYDPEFGVPIVAGPVPLPNELYRNIEDAKKHVQEYLGIYPLMQGNPSDAPDTYKGTVALEEFGQRRIQAMKRDIEGALTQFGRVVFQMVQAYYDDFRIIRVLKPNGKMVSVAFNTQRQSALQLQDLSEYTFQIKNIATGTYDILMTAGSTMPSNRWAMIAYYVDLYKNGILDQEEVLKKTEVADMEGVLERTSIVKQSQQIIEQQQSQIKQLSGDLQTAQREVVHARQALEVKNFEVEIAKQEAKIKAATEMFGARVSDEMKMMRQQTKNKTNRTRKNA
jgi:hypothetical protein